VGRQVFLPTLRPTETEYSEKAVPNAMTWSTHSRRSIRSPSWQNNFATASLSQWVYHGCSDMGTSAYMMTEVMLRERDAGRRRPGREPDGLPPPARSDRSTRRDGEGAAHPAAVCSGDGGDARARSLEGLAHERFFVVIRERGIVKQGRIFDARNMTDSQWARGDPRAASGAF